MQVSIRAPAWGATRSGSGAQRVLRFQFALPRGERPLRLPRPLTEQLFQFALPRGERQFRGAQSEDARTFQFALPRGERRATVTISMTVGSVSIRAPAWGATIDKLSSFCHRVRFNSRSRVGSDRRVRCDVLAYGSFNSRSRVGSDHPRKPPNRHHACFNSRSRVGSDPRSPSPFQYGWGFNSRSRVGSDATK